MLAALRAFWRRRSQALARAEARVILRRTVIALGSGLVTMAALAVLALGLGHSETAGWRTFTLIAAAVGAAALIALSPSVLRAARILPAGPGERGDIIDDLGPLAPARLHGRPWLAALIVATAPLAVATVQGAIASDSIDGLLRGLAEAFACLLGSRPSARTSDCGSRRRRNRAPTPSAPKPKFPLIPSRSPTRDGAARRLSISSARAAASFVAEQRRGPGSLFTRRNQRAGPDVDRQQCGALAPDPQGIPPRGRPDGLKLRLTLPFRLVVEPLAGQRHVRG